MKTIQENLNWFCCLSVIIIDRPIMVPVEGRLAQICGHLEALRSPGKRMQALLRPVVTPFMKHRKRKVTDKGKLIAPYLPNGTQGEITRRRSVIAFQNVETYPMPVLNFRVNGTKIPRTVKRTIGIRQKTLQPASAQDETCRHFLNIKLMHHEINN